MNVIYFGCYRTDISTNVSFHQYFSRFFALSVVCLKHFGENNSSSPVSISEENPFSALLTSVSGILVTATFVVAPSEVFSRLQLQFLRFFVWPIIGFG
jgi:hypothetical protein